MPEGKAGRLRQDDRVHSGDSGQYLLQAQRNIFENPKVVRAFAGLKIILGENFVAVSNSAELENLGFKVEDVLVGPVNFD